MGIASAALGPMCSCRAVCRGVSYCPTRAASTAPRLGCYARTSAGGRARTASRRVLPLGAVQGEGARAGPVVAGAMRVALVAGEPRMPLGVALGGRQIHGAGLQGAFSCRP